VPLTLVLSNSYASSVPTGTRMIHLDLGNADEGSVPRFGDVPDKTSATALKRGANFGNCDYDWIMAEFDKGDDKGRDKVCGFG
jgi:hypothetical protein